LPSPLKDHTTASSKSSCYAVTADPPSEDTLPPDWDVYCVMMLIGLVVNTGVVKAVGLSPVSDLPQEYNPITRMVARKKIFFMKKIVSK
jgi:hypothetical protein